MLTAKVSSEHEGDNMVMAVSAEPEMYSKLKFMGATGTVVALNDNYKGTGETWFIIEWDDDKKQEPYRYVIGG